MKKVIWILTLIVLLNIVTAVENKVFILDLNYVDGQITVNDIITKTGYAPDRKIQPEKGYRLEVLNKDNEVLYSFKFEVPLRIYTDVIDENGEIKGGVIILNETNFALIVPYYKDAEQIKVYDNKENEIAAASVMPALGERKPLKWIFGFIIIAIVLFFFFYEKKKKEKTIKVRL